MEKNILEPLDNVDYILNKNSIVKGVAIVYENYILCKEYQNFDIKRGSIFLMCGVQYFDTEKNIINNISNKWYYDYNQYVKNNTIYFYCPNLQKYFIFQVVYSKK